MEHYKQTILLAPALSNSSCWRPGSSEMSWTGPGPGELLRAALILLLSLGILFANLLVICVINSRRYTKYIHAQVRTKWIIFNSLYRHTKNKSVTSSEPDRHTYMFLGLLNLNLMSYFLDQVKFLRKFKFSYILWKQYKVRIWCSRNF